MPRVAMNYQNTIIYKIVCKDLSITECYVGSTTNFTKRKYQHKHSCNNDSSKSYHVNVYAFIRANGSWENWCMIEVEKFPCDNMHEALKRERYWIETLNATLNKVLPTRTQKEYFKLHADKKKDYDKQYRIDNADKMKDNNKKYRQNNTDKRAEYMKQYQIDNAEKLKEYKKQYREANAEKLKAQMKAYNLKQKVFKTV
jgi:hypothetical protein